MKIFITCGIAFVLISAVNCQDKAKFFVDELYFSINRTNVADENTSNRFGFGIGGLHVIRPNKRLQLILGFESNITNQFKDHEYSGHFAGSEDINYRFIGFTWPLGIRYFFGKGVQLFAESGLFGELIIISKKGLFWSYLPDRNGNFIYMKNNKTIYTGLDGTYGLFFGLGIKIPGFKNGIIIKTNYKMGFNQLNPCCINELLYEYYQLGIGISI